jgi:hypothetical protein
MPAGRPTLYSEEKLVLAKEYLQKCKGMLVVSEGFDPPKQIKIDVPSISALAAELEVARETIWDWCKDEDKKEFSNTINAIFALQEASLVENGLIGKFNPTMSIFLLKSNHGYIETEKRILAGDKENPLEGLIVIKHGNKTQ